MRMFQIRRDVNPMTPNEFLDGLQARAESVAKAVATHEDESITNGLSLPPLVPPLKCQGIKTKLVGEIRRVTGTQSFSRWVEPSCGSCVVSLNVEPRNALLSDSNVHMIRIYEEIQNGSLTPAKAKSFLTEEGDKLRSEGEAYYY